MKKSFALPAAALLAMLLLSISHPAAAAEEAELIHHYTLDGTLGDEVSTLVLQPPTDSLVHYAEDAPPGHAKSVLFGSDTEKETGRLIFPLAVKLPFDAGTISLWVKAPGYTVSAEGARYILNAPGQESAGYEPGKTAGCYIILRGLEGSIGCTLGGSELMQGGFPDLSEWTHLAISWSDERKSARLYLNGEQAAEVDILSGPIQSEVHPMRIGGFATAPGIDPTETQFQGMLSDLRIYQGELSGQEIATMCAITTATAGTPETNLAAARIFSNHMVLQRDHPVPVWGRGPDGAIVEVEFAGQKKSTTIVDDRWEVVLDPLPASAEGRSLVLTAGDRKITLEDILVGDVWLASGQSNMAMQLANVQGGQEAVAVSANPLLRLFTVSTKLATPEPTVEVEDAWRVSGPESSADMSAVAWFFAREIQQTQGIPVGLINCSHGGTVTETWCSPKVMAERWPDWERWSQQMRTKPNALARNVNASYLYNRMLKTVIPYAVRGFLWYQGEGNARRADEQTRLLPAMIQDWRKSWGNDSLPFYFVQLARYEAAAWHEFRCAQLDVWINTPNTFMAVTVDLSKEPGNHPIHPYVKRPIGERLARAARHFIYGEHDLLPSGPRFKDALPSEGKTVLSFDYAGAGLSTLDGQPLRGLYAGPLGGPLKAVDAKMQDDKLVIDHAAHGLSLPLLIRYGSEEDMGKETLDVNLGNSEKLPASPFIAKVPKV
jgi:sialate O-acetylesterase